MPDITPAVRPPSPTDLIRDAVNAAIGMGITVSTMPDLGVHCTSTHAPRWERADRVDAISPLGAVLLARQPPVPSADEALAHTLGVNVVWVVAFDEGCAGMTPSAAYAKGAPKTLYAQGYAAGIEFRAIMHRRAGVPVEVPKPVLVETPRQVIAELISSLTVAQVLDALADSIPGRAWSEPSEAADCAIELRAMAEEYRKVER